MHSWAELGRIGCATARRLVPHNWTIFGFKLEGEGKEKGLVTFWEKLEKEKGEKEEEKRKKLEEEFGGIIKFDFERQALHSSLSLSLYFNFIVVN